MKKIFSFLLPFMAFSLVACTSNIQHEETSSPLTEIETSEEATNETEDTQEMEVIQENNVRQISVQFGDHVIIYELNESLAADSLYEQLPLTVESEDFSTNEKIFYPLQELNTDEAVLAEGGSGVLAYYAPWGDVVMFYGDFNTNSSLYELGHIVSGEELIQEISGTITINAVE